MASAQLRYISRRTQAAAVVMALVAGFAAATMPTAAHAAPRTQPDKVTICHRTHAVTNPYRKITVSTNSVDGDLHSPTSGNEANGGSGDHAGYVHNKVTEGTVGNSAPHPDDVHTAPSASDLFDPNFTYQPNSKIWEDIIPPFTATRGNTVLKYPGMNWTDIGKAIYYGLTYNNVDYSGLCGSMGAKNFADLELAEYLSDNPNASPSDIDTFKLSLRNDLIDQAAENDPVVTTSTDLNSLPADTPKPKGPNKPSAFTSRIATLNAHNSNNPSAIKQALAGVVWKDMDSDGIKDVGEEAFNSVSISVKDPVTGLELTDAQLNLTAGADYSLVSYSAAIKPFFSFASFLTGSANFHTVVNTVTVTTDANGYFEIPSLPEGEWQVVVTTPDGWSYTYDSSGTNDGDMPGTLVPAGGVGFAWAGLVYTGVVNNTSGGTGGSGGSGSSGSGASGSSVTAAEAAAAEALANTGMNGTWYATGVVALQLIAAGAILVWMRRRTANRTS